MIRNKNFEFIENEIKLNDVVLFMKGNKAFPQCGYSAAVVSILQALGIIFKDINVLEDEELRQDIKDFTQWPTIPQLYIKGKFVGGYDIVKQMYETGELTKLLSNV